VWTPSSKFNHNPWIVFVDEICGQNHVAMTRPFLARNTLTPNCLGHIKFLIQFNIYSKTCFNKTGLAAVLNV